MATQNQDNRVLLDTDVSESDTSKDIAEKLKVSLDNVIEETINLLDFNVLEKVVEELRKAKRIFYLEWVLLG